MAECPPALLSWGAVLGAGSEVFLPEAAADGPGAGRACSPGTGWEAFVARACVQAGEPQEMR